jgi:hypothetical protein
MLCINMIYNFYKSLSYMNNYNQYFEKQSKNNENLFTHY